MTEKLTVAICTIHPQLTIRLLNSLFDFTFADQIIVILDGKAYLDDDFRWFSEEHKIQLIVNQENKGLAYSRNVAMKKAIHECLVFFDDDVVIKSDVIAKYAYYFNKGFDMLGGPLRLPNVYPELPKWLPDGLSSLLGIHTNQKRIWGGNFGFNVRKASLKGILFRIDLGRTGRQLQSGDDTTFIQEYCVRNNAKSRFVEELEVEHYINPERYTIKYLIRRAFWQGISEVRRNSLVEGLIKEFERAFSFGQYNTKLKLKKFVAGIFLFLCFLSGSVFEIANPSRFYKRFFARWEIDV